VNSAGPHTLKWRYVKNGSGSDGEDKGWVDYVQWTGTYVLTDTIGQPDAAWSSGGQYELLGGFWPGGPLCFVDFYSFARFAEWWLETGTGLPADLYEDEDNIVNYLDLKVFVEEWLYSCPYDWALR